MEHAKLERYGLISVSGEDARDFLHAQLTNDIKGLARGRAALAGWCTAKGRLLATFLVVPVQDGFLLQLSRDLVPAIVKRLSMFVLRSKVKVADATASWTQVGSWGEDGEPRGELGVLEAGDSLIVRVGDKRFLKIVPAAQPVEATAAEERWRAQEIQAGRPWISAATQDQFVPQMVNLEKLGGVDFHKGCYPGQEIVARAQYRGEVKRRMVRLPAPGGDALKPGQEYGGGTVVDVAGGEMLAVMPV